MSQKLFDEFPPVATETWMAAVEKDLKGASFEKRLVSRTLDGVRLKPFYREEDLPRELPASLRGHAADGNPWATREEIRETNPAEAHAHLHRALQRGASEVSVLGYPYGVAISNQEEMRAFLEGVILEAIPIHWLSGPLSQATLAMFLNEARRQGANLNELKGSVECDPLLDRCTGWTQASADSWKQELVRRVREAASELPGYDLVTVRGSLIEKAGASLAQELAFTLAVWNEYLVELGDAISKGELGPVTRLDEVVRRTELRFAVGTATFLEIAKLRAVRPLIENLLSAHGVSGVWPKIHVVTTSSNKTLYDPENNLLRATFEAMAAVMAGVDSLSVAAYNQGYQTPDEFSEHLARNTETLLKAEAHLGRVADPLGGSYTVEALTHDLAQAAWALFRQIEEQGGFAAVWQSGWLDRELTRVKADRARQVSQRKRNIVGTTLHANPDERRLGDVELKPASRQTVEITAPLDQLARELKDGRSLEGWITDRPTPSTVLDPFRPSWPYEHARLRVERHVQAGGKRPLIALIRFGDFKMSQARAGFCRQVFQAAGYEVVETTWSEWEAHPRPGADLVMLCSSDAEYLPFVRERLPALATSVAGYPAEDVPALREAGVAGFVHIRQDLLETIHSFHRRFGIPEFGPRDPDPAEAD